MFKILIIFFLLLNYKVLAETGTVTGLEIPRYVSLKSNDINLRVGPSINYPIKIKYVQKNQPVEIIEEFDNWRKIKDYQNNIGWIKRNLLKGDRYIIVIAEEGVNFFNRPDGKIIGLVKRNNILKINTCLIEWCHFTHRDIKGWILKKGIWGVYLKETFNIVFYQPLINQYWKILDSKLFK